MHALSRRNNRRNHNPRNPRLHLLPLLHRKVIETKIGNAVRSLSFYHLISVSIDMLSLVGFPCPTLLSLQPKINIKESITNVLSIILFIVFKYFDHFIALFFLYKIRRYYYDIIQALYSTPILLDQC